MAATLEEEEPKGSDVVYDVCCSICEDDGIHKEGLFNCQKCSKYFCDGCLLTHNKFLKDHSVTAKGGGDNWAVTKTDDDTLELCDEHTTEKLTMFCEDDEKLLCHVCLLRNHKQCSHVALLTDKVKSNSQSLGIAQMKTSINTLMERLEEMVKIGEQSVMSLQTSYEKVLEEIVDVRRLINDNLDRLQQNTERKLEELNCTLKISLESIRKHCIEFISKINGYSIIDIGKKSPERLFITYRKCLDQTTSADLFLRKATTNVAIDFHHNKDLEQFLASCTEFGSITSRKAVSHHVVDPNTVVSIKDKSQYNVQTATDKGPCIIAGICELSNGEFLIADNKYKCVKLLDRAYNLKEQMQLPFYPKAMCNLSINEVALIVSDGASVNEIHFLRVDKGMIVKFNTLKLNHLCYGIVIHQGYLFVTSGTAVCQYTMDGRLVKKLYEDKSEGCTVIGVGVSPDGKKIYATVGDNGKLLTLTRDGAVSATLEDPALRPSFQMPNLHVAATGHVFVIGKQSISQVDTIGKNVLTTIQLDMSNPRSVYFNEDTRKMIVGFFGNNNIFEFKT
ncbi:probable E3 ubiquitin-protein ligase MID2 isoform X2 [Dreissena polymorpha]|uniref:probable E3 ubiquitin-protein ligase MID2 isoform X2 n=1 Tax=Dreissena polymorpha TaxID=45954 RepID=UPI0022652454|nr:probable E3 ubiquitin-protein ligase MID2 isoform X2 [Dreissena polymorpha]